MKVSTKPEQDHKADIETTEIIFSSKLNWSGKSMKSVNWKDIAELVGIAAIVASLIFLGLQMQQAERLAQNEEDLAVLTSMISINTEMSENADIWLRGATGGDLSDTDAFIFKKLVHNTNLSAFFGYMRQNRMGRSEEARREIYDFASMLHRNPGARRVWLETEEEYVDYRSRLTDGPIPMAFWKQEVLSSLEKLDQH